MASFRDVPERLSFPDMEAEILEFWEKTDAFQESMRQSKAENRPEFTFYDGPPFATGTPHYGHILAGTIKDTVTRYAHQTGHHVVRRFGWDTHGLPVEHEVDKMLNIKSSKDVQEIGIAAYNAKCRSIVTRYCGEWEHVVKRVGRWVDFKNDYKTLEPWYMESVWWVFKTIFEKGLVYQGYRVMPYSTACTTPLSNFEAKMDYRDATDVSVVVRFPLVDDPDVSFVAWTTTPWTLPSNLSLCVNPDMVYVQIRDSATANQYILMEARLSELYPKVNDKKYKGGEFDVVKTFKGTDLVDMKYTPPFDYFQSHPNAFRVLADGYVTDEGGTGVVHNAPAHGEDDFRVCMEHGVIVKGQPVPCPIDADGLFEEEVTDFAGRHVKEADSDIAKWLKAKGVLVKKSSVNHSVAFCWRSGTPLISKLVPSWFVAVETFKDDLVHNNTQTYWVPAFVKEKRFHNWLADARDWNVSRNRYWGTPLPIWVSDDGEEVRVMGSIKELSDLCGQEVTDLHRESIDGLEIPSQQGKGMLKRVPEVFDCWFESGSMPYAQQHYPFENKDKLESNFPAQFIAEGLDQTRGWFYTLMVLSTALFNKPAFKNLIVNGLVLAEDGKKMSKSKKNYDDPMIVVNQYGADSLRLYLINSPVVRAEPLRFRTDGVLGVLKDVFLPWFNAFRFFVQNAQRQAMSETHAELLFSRDNALKVASASTNVMDRWVLAALHRLTKFVREEMEAYRLYTVVPALLSFVEQLTNWYVRLNRSRLKGVSAASEDASEAAATQEDTTKSLSTLYVVLVHMAKLMAPFTPFFAEYQYQELVQPALDGPKELLSVHFHMIPEVDESLLNEAIEFKMNALQTCINLGRLTRERKAISLKMPVKEVVIVHRDQAVLDGVKELQSYLESELNTRSVVLTTEEDNWCSYSAQPDWRLLGKRLGKDVKKVKEAIAELTTDQLLALQETGSITVAGHEIESASIRLLRQFKGDASVYESAPSADGKLLFCLNVTEDEELAFEGMARQVVNRIQKLRKEESLSIHDKINFFIEVGLAPTADAFKDYETASKAKAAAGASAGGADSKADKKKKAKQAKANASATVGVTAALPTPPSAKALAAAAQASVAGGETLMRAIGQNTATMIETLKTELFPISLCPEHAVVVAESIENIGEASFRIVLTRQAPCFPPVDVLMLALQLSGKEGEKRANGLMTMVVSMKYDVVMESEASGAVLEVELEGVVTALQPGVHFSAKMRKW